MSTLTLKDPTLLKDTCYVAGAWIGGAATIAVTNPADGSVIGAVPKLGAAETRRAIEAAEKAQKLWAKKTAKERAAVLRKWFALMMDNQEDLARIMTAEQGKPLAESRGEIAYGASFIEFFAEEGKRIYGETIPSPWPNARMVVIRQPVGVVAAITPWNFPNAMITRKAGPGARRRLRLRLQAGRRDAALGAGARRTRRTRRPAAGRLLGHHRLFARDRRGDDVEPDRARPDLHRLDRGRPRADGPMRPDHQEAWARTRRQRAVHRVRRRRSRRRGPGRDGLQIPQRRPDLRLRQPAPGAGRRLRRLRRQARRSGQKAQGRRRLRGRRHHRPADQRGGGRQGQGACGGRFGEGRDASWSAASRSAAISSSRRCSRA